MDTQAAQINNPLPLYWLSPRGLMQLNGTEIKMAYDPASPDGDYSCEVEYGLNADGVHEIVSWRLIAPKMPLGKKRKKRNE